jgi:hypothetical protein
MAKAEEVTEVTEEEEVPTEVPETPDSKILEMAAAVLSGTVFQSGNVDEIKEFRMAFGKFLGSLKGIATEFDSSLKTLRMAHGADYLPGVEPFRKPRTSKSANVLLDGLKL